MKRLYYIVKKEILEMRRDFMSVMLLILMPMAFILIMSLAMQALFQSHPKFKIKILFVDYDSSQESKKFFSDLKGISNLSFKELRDRGPLAELPKKMAEEDCKFALVLDKGFSLYFKNIGGKAVPLPVTILIDPTIQTITQLVVKKEVEAGIVKLKIGTFLSRSEGMLSYAGIKKDDIMRAQDVEIQSNYVYENERDAITPSAAQQSVPAWLVFSMYFLVIPISTIFHTEKSNGTFLRLRSINVKSRYLIMGKLLSYYAVSLVQVVCMLSVGRFVLPLFGGDTVRFGNSVVSLFLIASCTGLNAISYGLLISVISKNSQMAASLGVMLNLILAAIGGIMVPKFVMPKLLQSLSHISPFSWGMEGFLDIMLRNGSIYDILPECLLLFSTGAIMLFATGFVLKKKDI